MQILTNEEFFKIQLALCLLRESYAMNMVMITDFTEYGSVSFWMKVKDYWHNEANKFKLELNKIHNLDLLLERSKNK